MLISLSICETPVGVLVQLFFLTEFCIFGRGAEALYNQWKFQI
jgi:hypothetical protein